MDHTNNYNAADIQNGKGMSVLSYLGLFWLIPFFVNKRRNNPYVKFHMNQGLILLIINLVVSIAAKILCSILELIGLGLAITIIDLISSLIGFIILVFMIIGIINVVKGTAKELPFLGGIKILK